jgi:hypothetical protein
MRMQDTISDTIVPKLRVFTPLPVVSVLYKLLLTAGGKEIVNASELTFHASDRKPKLLDAQKPAQRKYDPEGENQSEREFQ